MTYYGGKELADSLRTVRKNTLKIAEDIPEEKYSFRPTPDVRSVGELLTHIALGHRFQEQCHAKDRLKTLDGFNFPAFMQQVGAEAGRYRSKPDIVGLLTREGEAWASWIEGLSEDFLAEPVRMSPGFQPATRSRFEMLLSTKEHEMHHRGQLMLIERLLGIVPHLTREMQARMAAAQSR